MRKLLIIFFFLKVSFAYCTLVTVAQDNTGDFSAIQVAINASASDDTILVYPGTYFENIDYMGKDLVIGSLNMTTGEDEYIHSTIIDGNNEGRVVTVESNEDEGTKIIGFTIQHGYFGTGGGIRLAGSYLEVKNCIIKNNHAIEAGGGILASNEAEIFLSGTTIKYNIAEDQCGGIIISRTSLGEFDQENLCNIYENYGPEFCDLGRGNDLENPEYFVVYLDTFSCLEPDRFFIANGGLGNNLNWEYLDLNVNTAYYEFYDGDLFVSPDGDDSNSGISPGEPMQTIYGAITRVVSNPDDPHAVHLAPGIYSHELNNQLFPLNMKAYVSIIGEDMDTVIWDGEDHPFILDHYSGFEYTIKNITFINGAHPPDNDIYFNQQYIEPHKVILENLKHIDVNHYEVYLIQESVEFEMNNFIIDGGYGSLLNYFSQPGNHSIIKNCVISGAGTGFAHNNYDTEGERSRLDVINTLIADNTCPSQDRIFLYNSNGSGYTTTNLVNCTIMNNDSDASGGPPGCVGALWGADFNIYNSVMYGNEGYEFIIYTEAGDDIGSTVNVSHSLIQGGQSGIMIDSYLPASLNWLDGNLDCDPLVDDDYLPLNNSPLINAGTLDLPEGIELPEFDLAGNPRIMGNGIDIGAYEFYNSYGDIDDNFVSESYDASLILMYVVGLDPIPEDPLPWEEWRIIRADVDLDGMITAYDATLILQFVVGIIDLLPVRSRIKSGEDMVSFSSDDEFIFISSENELFSLSYRVTETENLILGEADVIPQNCLFSVNGNRLALASAQAVSGKIIRLPYERSGDECSLTFEMECNGNIETIEYQFPENTPEVTCIKSIYPNPFNPETTISFFTKESTEKTELSIYNIRGQKVITLINGLISAGDHSVIWKGLDDNGRQVSGGVYLVRMQTAGDTQIKKVVLLK
ncbi:MAG: T9SS type A sorting domain-containing protein [Candidatus Cloacimonetes bacterium]|nr:T9SS type A sorting domain-containing protein [Candidatus Cloacimonadota bacterium]